MFCPKYLNCSIISDTLFHQVSVERRPLMSLLISCQMTGKWMHSTSGMTDWGQPIYSVNNLPQCHFHSEKPTTNHISHGTAQMFTLGQLLGGADKSLARPGRKQATATKLGIYSTHFPRSSIHFLARCSNFCKPLKKKNSEGCPSNQVSTAAMTSASDEKWGPFNCFFSPGNRW